jgi:hypothetical protein
VQSAIPTKYINTDPEQVAQNLYANHQIDADGNPVGGSDYENWITMCTTGSTYAITECMIPDTNGIADSTDNSGVLLASAEQDAQQKAYFAIYHTDQRVISGMDNEPKAESTGSGDTPSTGVSPSPDTPVPTLDGLPDGGVKDTADGRKQAWAMAQQFITDLNKIRKDGKGYPFKNISNYSLGYNRSSGTPGESSSGGPCFAGASNCDQCYALSAWFLDKYTSKNIGTTTSSGDGVVAYLKSKGVPTGNEAKVYSIFSYGRAVDGSGAHTGIVIGIDGDYAITLENNYNFSGTLYINKRPKDGAKFRGNGDRTVFAYVNDIISSSPKKY